MVCQICNDGDYTDDDLIVFCSVNIILFYFTNWFFIRDVIYLFIRSVMELHKFPRKTGYVMFAWHLVHMEDCLGAHFAQKEVEQWRQQS